MSEAAPTAEANITVYTLEESGMDADPSSLVVNIQDMARPNLLIADYQYMSARGTSITLGDRGKLIVAVQNTGRMSAKETRVSFECPDNIIPTDNIEDTYRDLCSEFRQVDAGGGLVSNRRGDFLLIKRSGLWDLPKGHQEPDEDIRTTALREVEEETGISGLELQELICITDHCYRRNGIWHLKHTWWFRMLDTHPVDLVPQKEEDISRAAWVAKSSLPAFLTNTYPSIAEVFREAKI